MLRHANYAVISQFIYVSQCTKWNHMFQMNLRHGCCIAGWSTYMFYEYTVIACMHYYLTSVLLVAVLCFSVFSHICQVVYVLYLWFF